MSLDDTRDGWEKFGDLGLITWIVVKTCANDVAALASAGELAPLPFIIEALLDSGCTKTFFAASVLQRLRAIPTGRKLKTWSTGESSEEWDEFCVDISVPFTAGRGQGLRCVELFTTQGNIPFGSEQRPYFAVVGMDLLRACQLTIDGPSRRFRLSESLAPSQPEPVPDAIATRVLVEGGGVNALASINVGETLLPVEDISWYDPGGGTVVCGPQRITYTGVQAGRTGSLVGPGAAPTAGPSVATTTGAGLETGIHDYAVTFVTAAGESLAGPRTSYSTLIPPPVAAPVAASPTGGAGPEDGAHDYAVTFVTAAGETTPGPRATVTTGSVATPAAALAAGTPTPGGSVDLGVHTYATTFVTAVGETTASPLSSVQTLDGIADPTAAQEFLSIFGAGRVDAGTHEWSYTFVFAGGGETLPSPHISHLSGGSLIYTLSIPVGPAGTIARRLYRSTANTSNPQKLVATVNNNTATSVVDNLTDAELGATAPSTNTTAVQTVPLSGIPIGPTGVTQRKIYRTVAGGAQLKLLTTLANNTATTFSDAIADGSLGANVPTTNTAYVRVVALSNIALGPSGTTQRKMYRTVAGASALLLLAVITDNVSTTLTDGIADTSLGAAAPTTNTANVTAASLTNLPLGGSTVTQRKIYRTAASATSGVTAGLPLKLLSTIADNTTTVLTDTTADASLGAVAPISDTSGLTQPTGLVVVGASTLPVAGAAAFNTTGGWAVIGNGQQVIRYGGIAGNSLTGIPAIGAGAITAAIGYNTMITLAPMLTGIPSGVGAAGSIRWPIRQGDPVNIFVRVDDEAAQAVLAALLATTLGTASDGIQEAYLQDRRLSKTECVARGRALLALQKSPIVSLQYTCRDINTASGKTITVNLPDSGVVGTFTIQHVEISGFSPSLHPTYTVTAAPTHVTFDDLMRQIQGAE